MLEWMVLLQLVVSSSVAYSETTNHSSVKEFVTEISA